MFARYEKRTYNASHNIWIAKYLNLNNISHWHSESEIVFVNQGKCDVIINNQLYSLNENEALFINGGAIHKIISYSSIISIIQINEKLINNIFSFKIIDKPLLTHNYHIDKIYENIYQEFVNKEKLYQNKIDLIISNLLIDIYRNENLIIKEDNNKDFILMKTIIEEIENNYAYTSFKQICEKINYSPSHFSRLFYNLTGTTFTDYLLATRIEHSIQDILNNNDNISTIAIKNGFNSIRSFNRDFKKFTSYTPKALPKDYEISSFIIKVFPRAFDPTDKNSILL